VVPIEWALQTRDHLQAQDYTVDWKNYPMQHAVCPQEVADIREWLLGVLRI